MSSIEEEFVNQALVQTSKNKFKLVSVERLHNAKLLDFFLNNLKSMLKHSNKNIKELLKVLYFGLPAKDPEDLFKKGLNEQSSYQDDSKVFGKGYYFYKTSAAANGVAYKSKKNTKFLLFGPVLLGDSTNTAQTEKGKVPAKPDGDIFDSMIGTGENSDIVYQTRHGYAYPCWYVEYTEE